MPTDLRPDIQSALAAFTEKPLKEAATAFLRTLGYASDRGLDLGDASPEAFRRFIRENAAGQPFDEAKALFADWKSADLLFQLTDEELSGNRSLFEESVQPGLLRSYLFFAIELTGGHYARGKLTAVARQLNRIFPMPVMVLMKHGGKDIPVCGSSKPKQTRLSAPLLSIAVINRRQHKRDAAKDVLGKVTIIRDISLAEPHRGHLDILDSFAFGNLVHPEKKKIQDFDTLHAAWEQIFNIELLNKRFYKELANWYFWALPQVEFPDDLEKDGEKRRATGLIRLLTRLIFCWFLKEKAGLIPEKLFHPADLANVIKDFDPGSETDSSYYLAILQNLFFATLNQRMGKDGKGNAHRFFARDEGFPKNKATHDVNNLYRYETLFAVPEDEALALFADIPFLNGGLFECLDQSSFDNPVGVSPKKRYLDGFTRNPQKRPRVPNRLFFDAGETADLSAAYGDKKRKKEPVCGLISILNRYKFTIIENTPIDQEIALDPELLGKVFENLLASYNEETKTTARKQTGSFYTPRPIVDYMVDESLKAHLEGKVAQTILSAHMESKVAQTILSGTSSNDSQTGMCGPQDSQTRLSGPQDSQTRLSGLPITKTRRNLPHWSKDGAIYWVTFRLADSLPREKLAAWKAERDSWIKHNPEPWDEKQWREFDERFGQRLEAWLDAGEGECHLRRPALRAIVEKCLLHFDGDRYNLGPWVIMPNHVHMLITPRPGHTLSKIMQGIKGVSARECNALLGRTGEPFWQDESFDHIVRSQAQFDHFVRYIAENPAKARLKEGEFSLQGSTGNPACGKAGTKQGGTGNPACGNAGTEQGSTSNPACENAGTEQGGTGNPACGNAGTEQGSTGNPACENAPVGQSGTGNPACETQKETQTGLSGLPLGSQLPSGSQTGLSGLRSKLDHLFSYTDEPHPFTPAEVDTLITAIDEVKILDPACGSGAFPMGVLHKLVYILSKLDPDNERWKQTQLAKLDSAPMREELERAFEDNNDDYGRKLYLIENCLYGVDIQPIAIQITKLRFFISLVCDQKTNRDKAKNHGIRPLPNLETKFVAANTLIGLPVSEQDLFVDALIAPIEKEIEAAYHSHFSIQRRDQKLALQKKIKSLRAKLADTLATSLGALDSAKAKHLAEWDPFDPQASADFFDPHWMFGLSVARGFDITIGNPPYVRADEQSESNIAQRAAILESKQYETLWEKWDLYVPFLERSYKLLRAGGVSTMIVSDAFCHSKYAQKAQNWFLQNARILRLDFCGEVKIFDAAVHNVITFFQKAEGANSKPLRRLHRDTFGEVTELPSGEQVNLTNRTFFPEKSLHRGFSVQVLPVGSICYVSFGCRPNSHEKHAKGLFVAADLVSGTKDKNHPKPYIEAKEIVRWNYKQTRWLEWGTSRSPKLLTRPTFVQLYEVPEKIVAADVSGAENRAAYDENKVFHSHTLMSFVPWYFLTGIRNNSLKKSARYRDEKPPRPDLPKREDLEANSRRFAVKYLLGVMNSSTARDFLRANRRSNIHLYPDDWKKLPIPDVSAAQQQPIIDLVDQILTLKRADPESDIGSLEAKVDEMVANLYNPTPEEIAIVEGTAP